MYPKIAATVDEAKMTNLVLFIIFTSSNASNVIKMDIVNPIPANVPTPKMCFQFKSLGIVHKLSLVDRYVNNKIPKGLPSTSPKNIPKLYFSKIMDERLLFKNIIVLAKAKIGNIKNATGLCKNFCKMYEVDFSSPLPKGIAKANSTPDTVACTPEFSIKYHMATPPIR